MSEQISSSVYNIQKRWLEEIAPKFLNIQDINKLKAGFFGYANEVMANSVEDNIHMHNIMSNEIFPNRAVLPNSIYAYSSLAQFEDFNAKPAIIPFVLAIKKADIITAGEQKNGYKELLISKYSKMVIEDKYPFVIDYDLRITARPTRDNTDYVLSAQYVIDVINPISTIKTPYIQSVVLDELGDEFLFIRLIGRQLDRQEHQFMIYSNDVVENINFEVGFEGKLAGFNVYYRKPNQTNFTQIEKYFVDSYKPESPLFCFYTYTGENKINISFSPHPNYFRPEFNSELRVEIFTTQGKEGNFTYSGNNVEFLFYSEDNLKDFSNILSFTQVMGDSIDGEDRPDISEIKQGAIREFSSRGNLITDIDLQNYFNSKSKSSKIMLAKKMDDIFRRIHSAFLLLKDDNGNIIPTNTINAILHDYQFNNFKRGNLIHTLKAGTMFELYDLDSNIYTVPERAYTTDELLRTDSNPNNYIYGNPFLIKVTTNPHFMSYYLNSVFDTHVMDFKYMNKEALDEFIVNNMKIERNAIKSDQYQVHFNLMTTIPETNIIHTDSNARFLADKGGIKAKGLITEKGKNVGYFDFKVIGKTPEGGYTFEANLKTDDFINSDDKLNLVNSVYSVSQVDETLFEGFALGNNDIKISICLFYNGYDDKSKGNYSDVFPSMYDYCLTNVYETDGNVELFKDLNSIMHSTILTKLEPNGSNGFYYKIKSMPMVRYLYLQNDENMKQIIRLMDYFKDILTDTLNVVENNFNIDMKFYNTYGPSKFFSIGTQKERLNTVGITIKLEIKNYGDINRAFIGDIRDFIIKFVEDTNNDGTNFLYMSNMIRKLEETFPDVAFTVFVGFNEYPSSYQIIENNFKGIEQLKKEQVINFIPEYLNVNRIPVMENGVTKFEPDIQIKFV